MQILIVGLLVSLLKERLLVGILLKFMPVRYFHSNQMKMSEYINYIVC